MSVKKVKENNDPQFVKDFRRVFEIMVWCEKTRCWLWVKKKDVWDNAQKKEIRYYITNEIFVRKRDTMVII